MNEQFVSVSRGCWAARTLRPPPPPPQTLLPFVCDRIRWASGVGESGDNVAPLWRTMHTLSPSLPSTFLVSTPTICILRKTRGDMVRTRRRRGGGPVGMAHHYYLHGAIDVWQRRPPSHHYHHQKRRKKKKKRKQRVGRIRRRSTPHPIPAAQMANTLDGLTRGVQRTIKANTPTMTHSTSKKKKKKTLFLLLLLLRRLFFLRRPMWRTMGIC